jgi:hypothetical protein
MVILCSVSDSHIQSDAVRAKSAIASLWASAVSRATMNSVASVSEKTGWFASPITFNWKVRPNRSMESGTSQLNAVMPSGVSWIARISSIVRGRPNKCVSRSIRCNPKTSTGSDSERSAKSTRIPSSRTGSRVPPKNPISREKSAKTSATSATGRTNARTRGCLNPSPGGMGSRSRSQLWV